MRNLLESVSVILLFTFSTCEKVPGKMSYLNLLDTIPSNKYYSNKILNEKYLKLYGTWKVYSTSGGFTGTGYKPDFDYLVMKPNGIFGVVRNDTLITAGKIIIRDQTDDDLLVDFIPEKDPDKLHVEILQDSEKYVTIKGDTLHLNAPCCDRFNTSFVSY